MEALIARVRAGRELGAAEVKEALTMLLSETIAPEAKEQFLVALHQKGETASEMANFVRVLLERAVPLELEEGDVSGPMIDVCGSGGDGINLFNVSTAVMFVLAAGGATVVKHGNRSVTSRCGSADVLEALGIPFNLEPAQLRECIREVGLGFVYARVYHPAFRALAAMRQKLAKQNQRTIFNLIGPLLNPARPPRQLLGVFSARWTMPIADVLRQLGAKRAWVVNGTVDQDQSLDDVSTLGPTAIAELQNGRVSSAVLDTRWLGIAPASLSELVGDDARTNSAIILGILHGTENQARRDLVAVNAGAGFVVAGLARDMNEGIALAREQLDSKRALAKLQALQNYES